MIADGSVSSTLADSLSIDTANTRGQSWTHSPPRNALNGSARPSRRFVDGVSSTTAMQPKPTKSSVLNVSGDAIPSPPPYYEKHF